MINRTGALLLTAAVFALIALAIIFQIHDRREIELRATEDRLRSTVISAMNVISTLKDVETGQRGFLITGQRPYLNPYLNGLKKLDEDLSDLQKRASDRSDSSALADDLAKASRLKLEELKATITLRAGNHPALALARVLQGEGLKYMDDARRLTATLIALEESRIRDTRRELDKTETYGRVSMFVGCAVLFLLLTFGAILLAREAAREAQFAAGLEASEQRYRRLSESLEETVQARTGELQAVNRELEAFSFSVSHDLRAPLRSIDGFSMIILEDYADKLDEEGRRLLGRIRLATVRMGQLISSLLELSRVSRGELRRERVSLSSMAGAILEGLSHHDPVRKVNIEVQPNVSAEGDPELLHIVLDNLLSNAWKFTSKEGNPCIEFGTSQVHSEEKRAFYVRDNGAGFDPAQSDRLFTPFQRLHLASDFEGIGIGLATVKRVIHRHGGELWATSTPGKGATFFFTLP